MAHPGCGVNAASARRRPCASVPAEVLADDPSLVHDVAAKIVGKELIGIGSCVRASRARDLRKGSQAWVLGREEEGALHIPHVLAECNRQGGVFPLQRLATASPSIAVRS